MRGSKLAEEPSGQPPNRAWCAGGPVLRAACGRLFPERERAVRPRGGNRAGRGLFPFPAQRIRRRLAKRTCGLRGPVIRRQAAQQRGLDGRRHDGQIALARGGDGFDFLAFAGFQGGSGGLPLFKAGANFFFQRRPGRCQEAVCGFHQGQLPVFLLAGGTGEEVQFFAGAGGGDIK